MPDHDSTRESIEKQLKEKRIKDIAKGAKHGSKHRKALAGENIKRVLRDES
jgi:hypothetical protein